MAGQENKIQDDVRFRILRLRNQNPEVSQRELAQPVGVGNGSVCHVLKALVEGGSVKIGDFSASNDKRRYAYVLTPKSIAEKVSKTESSLMRKMA